MWRGFGSTHFLQTEHHQNPFTVLLGTVGLHSLGNLPDLNSIELGTGKHTDTNRRFCPAVTNLLLLMLYPCLGRVLDRHAGSTYTFINLTVPKFCTPHTKPLSFHCVCYAKASRREFSRVAWPEALGKLAATHVLSTQG